MNTDIVRVVRILEYTGPEATLKDIAGKNAVQGCRQFGHVTIREATLPNWEVAGEHPKPHGDDILVWADGYYCDRSELSEHTIRSDDYTVLWVGTGLWTAFVRRDSGRKNPTYFSLDMDGSMVPDPDGEWVRR